MSRTLSATKQTWTDLWTRLGCTNATWIKEQFSRMKKRYQESHRRYHTFVHIEYGLPLLREYAHLVEHSDAVLLAWFLHDVIYHIKPTGKLNNEMRSARYAMRLLHRGVPHQSSATGQFQKSVFDLIRSTEGRVSVRTQDQRLLSDIDWSIIGQPWAEYVRYIARVRAEYSIYNDKEFCAGRAAWIKQNQKEKFFFLPEFNARFGDQAKENLVQELTAYETPDFAQLWELP